MEFAFMLVTAGLSAVMAGLVTYKVNESKEARSFRGKKAEELYRAVEAFDRELSRFFDPRCAIADSSRRAGVSSDDALQIAGARLVDAKMLVGFYFPALSSALARCVAAVATAHASLRLWESADAANRDDLLEGFDRDVVAVKDSLESFKAAIIDSGRVASQPTRLIAWRRRVAISAPGRALRVAA
jgi:hypothetical protein